MDKHDHWRQLAALLTSALDAKRNRIPSKDAEIVQYFIDHNEYGLAYEHLNNTIDEERLLITEEAKMAMKAAANFMNL
ncbi:hypothetical protein GCM10011494_17890 [Novosphingobium endophyticum]|uniref:Uncharacterized protein n=1 Tax=Novosphingobium endophyticum TaxID=1955250 RepID=A0A916TSQ6_9SPHN|nr:MafI family immunity protein [Novosphingobium endophyticum]GGB99828.1 hypothetical protein GCM10011494_17890 [Novosphingobium endophyticum]